MITEKQQEIEKYDSFNNGYNIDLFDVVLHYNLFEASNNNAEIECGHESLEKKMKFSAFHFPL